MPTPSLFPLFMKAQAGSQVIVEDVIVALQAEPDVKLEPDLVVTVEETPIDVEVDPDISIEVE